MRTKEKSGQAVTSLQTSKVWVPEVGGRLGEIVDPIHHVHANAMGTSWAQGFCAPPPKKMVPPAHVQSWCFSRSTRCQFGGRQKIWYFKDTDESCLKWHGAIFGLFKISKRCLQMHMSVARKNAETSTRGKKVWVAFPQFYVLRCGLRKKMAVQPFLELGGGKATCPDTGLSD